MNPEEAQKQYLKLKKQIEYHSDLYYNHDAPELDDFAYDALWRDFKALEAAFPQLVTQNSPTQHVGGTVSAKFDKVTHTV
ncbi:MAG: NAD-dependent DNA ligase LigA, partial [Ruthenibacterium sp.]